MAGSHIGCCGNERDTETNGQWNQSTDEVDKHHPNKRKPQSEAEDDVSSTIRASLLLLFLFRTCTGLLWIASASISPRPSTLSPGLMPRGWPMVRCGTAPSCRIILTARMSGFAICTSIANISFISFVAKQQICCRHADCNMHTK